MQSLVGIDIGGTNTKIGIIQHGEQFQVLKQVSILSQVNDPADVYIQRTARAVKELIVSAGRPQIAGVGVGCPGLIDPWKGLVRNSPNLPTFEGLMLKDKLGSALGLGVEIQNDANAAVLGEWLFSPASKGVRNMCILTLGTGVGGGCVCDGHLLVGADNAATEFGHLKVEWNNGALCGCGRRGCVEAYAGAAGIVRTAYDLIQAGGQTSLRGEFTTKEISEAAAKGDPVGQQTLYKVGQMLGRCICTLIETFNTEKIVLGGGASAAMELLRPGLMNAIQAHASFAFTRDRVKIERSAFPDDINVIGAAATYLNAHRQA